MFIKKQATVAAVLQTSGTANMNKADIASKAAMLNSRFAEASTSALLEYVLKEAMPGQVSVVSSFGTESAVLLHLVAAVDPATPVIFIDTLKLFGETLRYRDQLVTRLGLFAVKTITPLATNLAAQDPNENLWQRDPDACCYFRKVEPLQRALENVGVWISGRKSFQAETRSGIPLFEEADGRLKINPLAKWSKADLEAYFIQHDLPRHPLEADGYLSIGCMPCTSPVTSGEDIRSGRWRGQDKTECGIHAPEGQTKKLGIF